MPTACGPSTHTGTFRKRARRQISATGSVERRWRSDVADHHQFGSLGDVGEDVIHNLRRRRDRIRQMGDHDFCSRALGGLTPDALHRSVFVIGQKHLIARFQHHAGRDDVHAEGGIVHEQQILGTRPDQLPQALGGFIQMRFKLPEEKIHRLRFEPLAPLPFGLLHARAATARRSRGSDTSPPHPTTTHRATSAKVHRTTIRGRSCEKSL